MPDINLTRSNKCDHVTINKLGNATWKTQCHFNNLFASAGRATGGKITDAGSETVNVAAGTGFIKKTDSDIDTLYACDWVASNGISVPTDTVLYIGVEYDSVSGAAQITTKASNTWNYDTEFPLGSVINQAGTLYLLNNPWWTTDAICNIMEKQQADRFTSRDNKVGGLILGTSSTNTTRKPTLTAGVVWSRVNEFIIDSKDCSGTDTFYGFYRDGGTGWIRTVAKTDIDDFYDNNSGVLQALNNNKFVNFWFFVEIDTVNNGQLMMIYPQNQYNTSAEAETESVPVFPSMWYEHGVFLGRVIVKQGVTAPVNVQTVFSTVFSAALAADHSNLSGLSDDDHPQYVLVDGTRALGGNWSLGGYNLTNGGSITGSTLTDGVASLNAGALSGVTTISLSGQLTSTLAIGTAPLNVTSTTVNTNLNADLLDGMHASELVPVGTIVAYGGATAPTGWLMCNGNAVSRSTYSDLFSAISTSYGAGDGSTTFNVPDMRQRFALGKADSGTGDTLGGTGGAIDHTHTMSSHTHSLSAHTHTMSSHTHGMESHTHTMSNHTHTMSSHTHDLSSHTHTMSNHTHAMQSHTHTMSNHLHSLNSHTHTGTTNSSNNNTGVSGGISSKPDNTHGHTFTTGGPNRNSGTNNDATAGPNTNTTGSNNNATAGPSNNTSGINNNATAANNDATAGPSTNTTSANNDATAGPSSDTSGVNNDATASNNPPYLVINYIIKY